MIRHRVRFTCPWLIIFCSIISASTDDGLGSTSARQVCSEVSSGDLSAVDVLTTNDSDSFFKEYVVPGRPAVIPSNEFINELDLENLIDRPEAFTTYVDVKIAGRKWYQMSIRQVLRSDKDITVNVPIPSVIKALIPLPPALGCEAITKNLLETRLKYAAKEKTGKPTSNNSHSFICQIVGNNSIILENRQNVEADVKKEKSPNIQTENSNKGSTQNFVKNCHQVYLSPGDCMFLPAGWSYQKNSSERSLTARISWKTDLPASEPCGNVTDLSLLPLVFQRDPAMDIMSFFSFGNLHHFIESYFLNREHKEMTLSVFQHELKKDTKIKKTWNEEDERVTEQIFTDLDVNIDAKLSLDDFNDIKLQDLKNLAKKVDDAYKTLSGGNDQLSGLESILELTKTLGKKVEGNIASVTDSFAELFREIDEVEKEINERVKNGKADSQQDVNSQNADESLKSLNDMLDKLKDEL